MNEQTNPKPLDEETVDNESSEGTQEQITDRESLGTTGDEVETQWQTRKTAKIGPSRPP